MANIIYCRWENTLIDLRDCAERVNDPLVGSEARARGYCLQITSDNAETSRP